MSNVNDISGILSGAQQERRNHLINSFSNSKEVIDPEDRLSKAEEVDDFEKGIYANNSENRKLGRVGQKYREKKEVEKENLSRDGVHKKDGKHQYDGMDDEDDSMEESLRSMKDGQLESYASDKSLNATEKKLVKKEMAKRGLNKSDIDDLNPFEIEASNIEKAKSEGDIEKGGIFDSIQYEKTFQIKKTGKQIKEQISTILLPELGVELAIKKSDIDALLANCGEAPTKDVNSWWTNDMKIEVGHKVYDWEETYIKNENSVAGSLSYENSLEVKAKLPNLPATQEIADNRRNYNDRVREACSIMADIKACEIINQISDDETVELSPRQIIIFKF